MLLLTTLRYVSFIHVIRSILMPKATQFVSICRECGNFLYLTPNEKGTLTQSFASYISWLKMQKKYCQIVLFSLKTFTEGLISSTQVCFDFLLMSSYIHGIKSPNNESCFPEFFSSNFSQFEQSKKQKPFYWSKTVCFFYQ